MDKIDNVPKKVVEAIDIDEEIQVFNRSGKVYYIIYRSKENVKVRSETVEKTVLIKLEKVNPKDEDVKQYVYCLTMDQHHDTIDIQVNENLQSIQ